MKETIFRFELRVDSENLGAVLHDLKNQLGGIPGVLSIESESRESFISLAMRVRFGDSEAAMKLHRKLTRIIKGLEGVTISEVTTTLTDIY